MPKFQKPERFSKRALSLYIATRRALIAREYKFDSTTTAEQLNPKDNDAHYAFGAYEALANLADHMNLPKVDL